MELYEERKAEHIAAWEEAGATEATGYSDWHEWQTHNWGIKWGDCNTSTFESDDEVTLVYETPWGPFGMSSGATSLDSSLR